MVKWGEQQRTRASKEKRGEGQSEEDDGSLLGLFRSRRE